MSQYTDLTLANHPDQLPAVITGQPPLDDVADHEDVIDLSEPEHLNPRYFVPPQSIQGPITVSSFTSVPFSDLPLYIPGLTQNVVGFDGGINKAALEVHRDDGLLCNLLPYQGMAERDFVELFCNDLLIPVATYNVTQDDVDKERIIPLYIPRTRLPDGPANPVFMRVTRLGGGRDETQRLNLKVDTVPPAGVNPIGSTLQNENLPTPIFQQHIIDFGVTETDAENGVPVTFKFYPVDATQLPATYRAPRDRIRLRINGITAPIPPVTEGQASGREDITVVLYYGFWQQVRSGSHVCEYEVIDEVGNASQGWSPAQLLNVRLDDGAEPLLPEAYFREAPEDILNHDELDGQDATIIVSINRLGYQLGDVIRATVNGRSASGSAVITTYDSAPLTSTTVREITLPCPNEDLRQLIGGRLQLFYERIRSGTPNRRSESIIVDVTGTPIDSRLRPPLVVEAVGGILDPQTLFVNVVVNEYTGQDRFDRVTLILDGQYANGNRYYRELDEPAGTGDVLFRINNGPNGEIAALEGGTLRFLYQVTNDDGTRTSQDVTVNVGSAVASLPEPEVAEAPAPLYQFDPEESTGDANILVRSHPDFLEGDTVTLYCEGSAAGGTAPPQPFPILRHWVGQDLPFTLQRRYILANIDRTMRIYYTRERDNVLTRFSHPVNMKVGARLELRAPTVVEATVTGPNQASLNPLHVLPPHRAEVTIRVVTNTFPPGADIKVFITGKPGLGMPDIPAKPARPEAGENYTSFTVPNDFVGAYLGGECQVFYQLLEIGKTTKSDELTLRVEALAAQEWDRVSIPEAVGGVIDANRYASVLVQQYPFMKAGQRFWITLKGDSDLVLRNGVAVTQAEVLAKKILQEIPSEYLTSLTNGSSLRVEAKVSLDGLGAIDSAISLVIPPPYQIKKAAGIITHINVGVSPARLVASPDGKRVYVCNDGSDSVSVIDTATNKVIYTITGSFSRPHGIAIHPNGGTLYVSNVGSSTVSAINTSSFSTIYTISGLTNPYALTLNNTGTRLYVASSHSAYTYIYDTSSGARLHSIDVRSDHYSLALNPTNTWLYVATGGGIYVINATNNAFNTIILEPTRVQDMAHSPYTPRLYMANTHANNVMIANTNSNTLHKTLYGFSSPYGIAFNPVISNAYVADTNSNTLKVIDTETENVINSIPGFNRPRGIAVLPDGSRVYVTNTSGGTVTVVST